MGRINLFAKGNVDVHDSLHSCRIGGEVRWNGINEVLRAKCKGGLARLRHETATGALALAAAGGVPPQALTSRDGLLGAYPAASQFSAAIFDSQSDAIILSILPDVVTQLFRHRTEGYLFYVPDISIWPPAERTWLRKHFEPLGKRAPEKVMTDLEHVIDRVRQNSDAPVLIYNLSPIDPAERIHCYSGLEDALSLRIREFNTGLSRLSARTGVSIVDVDSLLAREGATRMKLDAVHLTPEAYGRVAEEVVRILDDLGVVCMRREL